MAAGRRSGAGSDRDSIVPPSPPKEIATDGSIHRPGLQAVPPGEDQALSEGRQVRLAEVPDRDPALPAGRARPEPAEGRRLPPADPREAEGPPDLRHPRAPVPRLLRRGGPQARPYRRDHAPAARAAAG